MTLKRNVLKIVFTHSLELGNEKQVPQMRGLGGGIYTGALSGTCPEFAEGGQHLIHYLGWYSNKERGLRKKREASSQAKSG